MTVAAKKGLGTGLDVLFGELSKEEEQKELVQSLPISKIEPREGQPRTVFDEEALGELADSIREYGLLMPVTVRKLDSGYYQLIAGERRWRAARIAGLSEIPARVIEADDRLATELALVENLQREDLNPVEEAQGYRTLMEDYGLTQDEAAQRVGKSRPAVANACCALGKKQHRARKNHRQFRFESFCCRKQKDIFGRRKTKLVSSCRITRLGKEGAFDKQNIYPFLRSRHGTSQAGSSGSAPGQRHTNTAGKSADVVPGRICGEEK